MIISAYLMYSWKKRRNREHLPRQAKRRSFFAVFQPSQKKLRKTAIKKLTNAVHEHRGALSMNWRSAVTVDEYGTYQIDRWRIEAARFLKSIDFHGDVISKEEAIDRVTEVMKSSDLGSLTSAAQSTSLNGSSSVEQREVDPFAQVEDPLAFEAACAQALRTLGWSTRLTTGSGDQGIDVLAQKGHTRIVVQCKMYAAPVGNKAVQEVYAGKAFANADAAVVVASNGYTKSAKELAGRTGVHLLSPQEIMDIDAALDGSV